MSLQVAMARMSDLWNLLQSFLFNFVHQWKRLDSPPGKTITVSIIHLIQLKIPPLHPVIHMPFQKVSIQRRIPDVRSIRQCSFQVSPVIDRRLHGHFHPRIMAKHLLLQQGEQGLKRSPGALEGLVHSLGIWDLLHAVACLDQQSIHTLGAHRKRVIGSDNVICVA